MRSTSAVVEEKSRAGGTKHINPAVVPHSSRHDKTPYEPCSSSTPTPTRRHPAPVLTRHSDAPKCAPFLPTNPQKPPSSPTPTSHLPLHTPTSPKKIAEPLTRQPPHTPPLGNGVSHARKQPDHERVVRVGDEEAEAREAREEVDVDGDGRLGDGIKDKRAIEEGRWKKGRADARDATQDGSAKEPRPGKRSRTGATLRAVQLNKNARRDEQMRPPTIFLKTAQKKGVQGQGGRHAECDAGERRPRDARARGRTKRRKGKQHCVTNTLSTSYNGVRTRDGSRRDNG
ncbi:hypothetical protein B0H16DRAFT_1702434 [Mycena metata]|uniref:Uncharacterized protein n=1 Tax=Mycena metata TaxID=1033252 RepID=A0AAD7MES5_9AGAR|nr:hypothetical protein B0H16DRAFT_1702434 [Mycena metata]